MLSDLTRRDFLRVSALAPAAIVAAPSPVAKGKRKRVVIIGAGLAGLAAAYEILKAHPSVQVFVVEAQDRVGGRVLTARADQATGRPFDEGQYVELGAHRIPSSHDRTLSYVEILGLGGALREFSAALPGGGDGRLKYILGETSFYSDEAKPDSLALTEFERDSADFIVDYEYEYKYATGEAPPQGHNGLGAVSVPPYQATDFPYGEGTPALLDAWDAVDLAAFRAGNGASADWNRFYATNSGSEIHAISTVAWLAQVNLDWSWSNTYYLDGGLDQIAERLARTVKGAGGSIRRNQELKYLEQRPSGVEVGYRDEKGSARSIIADEVIVTVPFPVLRNKGVGLVHADLGADKHYWINRVQMTAATRIALQVKQRFWHDEGIEGLSLAGTDTPAERVWHSTNTQPGASGIIQGYLLEDNARNAPVTDSTGWLANTIAQSIFPQVSDTASGWNGQGAAKHWHHDQWAGGAWSLPRPGEFIQGFPVWGRAEGRIHFAGEHTSLYSGWMQGAIESGQRTAAEVLARL